MPASRNFGDDLLDAMTTDYTGKIGKGIKDTAIQTWETVDKRSQLAGGEIFKGVEAFKKEYEESGDFLPALGEFSKHGTAASDYLYGASFGALMTPVEMAVTGTLQGAAPDVAQEVGSYVESAYEGAGGSERDRAIVDTALFGLGALAGTRVKGKSKPATMEDAIAESLESVSPAQKADIASEISRRIDETIATTGRGITEHDVMRIAEEIGEAIDEPSVSALPERSLGGIPNEVFEAVGNKTHIPKTAQKAILDSLEDSGIPRNKAGIYVKEALKENQRALDTSKPIEQQVRDAFDVVAAKSEMGKDVELKKFKYDQGDTYVGENYALLEEQGYLRRSFQEDGLYSFKWTEKANGMLPKSVRQKTAMGVAHYPASLYDKIRASRGMLDGADFDTAAKDLVDMAIENPLEAPKLLNRIEEANGNANMLKRPPTNEFLYKNVRKAVDEYEVTGKLPEGFEADFRSLGTRLGTETDHAFGVKGIDDVKLGEVMKEFKEAKLNGFRDLSKLPIPDSLKKMFQRDELVAKKAFSRGIRQEKMVAEAKLRKAKGEEKARLSEQSAKFEQLKDWRSSIRDKIKNFRSDGDFVFYGTQSDLSAIAGKFWNKAEGVKGAKAFDKVMQEAMGAIVEANAKAISAQITKALRKYKRPAGKTTAKNRKIDVESRIALEAMAQGADKYRRTGDVSHLTTVLEDIKRIERMGKEKFKLMSKMDKEQIKATIEEARSQGIESLGDATMDDRLLMKTKLNKMWYKGLDPVMLMTRAFDKAPKIKNLLNELMDADRRVQLLGDEFVTKVAEPLDKAGWIGAESSRKLGVYLITKQEDWAKRVYGKDGFFGHNVFPFVKFADESEYLAYVDNIRKEVEGNKSVLDAVKKAEEIRNRIDDSSRTAALLYDKYQYGRVENYYPQRAIRNGAPMQYGEDIFSNDGFRKGYQEERAYDKATQYDPDFFDDYMRYVNTQGRYGEMRGMWGNMGQLIDNGLLATTNNFTRDLAKGILKDLSNPQPLQTNLLSRATSRITKITLAARITTILSQFLSVPEAMVRVRPRSLRRGVTASFRPKAVLAAQEASTALQLAKNGGMLINEMQKISDSAGVTRYIDSAINNMMFPIGKADSASKIMVWLSAYDDAFKAKYGKDFDFNNPVFNDRELVLHADDVVESIVGTKTYARIPQVLRNPAYRAILMLQTFVIKRMGLLGYELPREFRKNPYQASAALATFAMTGVMPMFIGATYKEALEALAGLTGQEWIGDDKDMAYRLTGVRDAKMEDILFAAIKTQITGAIPGTSNMISVANYDRTGIGVFDFFKKGYENAQLADMAREQGNAKGATAATIDTLSSFLGEPGRLAGEAVKALAGVKTPKLYKTETLESATKSTKETKKRTPIKKSSVKKANVRKPKK